MTASRGKRAPCIGSDSPALRVATPSSSAGAGPGRKGLLDRVIGPRHPGRARQ